MAARAVGDRLVRLLAGAGDLLHPGHQPAVDSHPARDRRRARGAHAKPIIDVVAPSILVLGIIRGTLLGPIDSVEDAFTTAYGLTWLLAIVTIVAVFLWGRIVIIGAVDRLAAAPLTPDGGPTPELEVALAHAKRVTVLELLGFLLLFTLMILMRFGL
jgi:hypothetical protein